MQATIAEAATVSTDEYITSEIIRRYLIATVDEMVHTTTRTAYSTCFSEALDFSCALFDQSGSLVAQAAGIPVHVGAIGDVLTHIMTRYDTFEPGDVVVHNDPYSGGTHQADVLVARPMFFQDEMVGFAVNRGHWSDIGGTAAGGWGGNCSHVIQEALLIPASKLYRAGELVEEIQQFILRNVRLPRQAWGDLQAQIASAITAERRVADLCERYGWRSVRQACANAIDYSRRRWLSSLECLPDGVFTAEDFMDGDGWSTEKLRIRVEVRKQGSDVTVDFTGSSKQANGPINSTLAATKAGTFTALINVVDPDIPINAGCIEAVKIVTPPGSLVNPTYPAPVFAGLADTAARICETIFLALADVVPDRVAAGSYATGNNTSGWGRTAATGEDFVWYSFGPGGCGARAAADGNTVDWDPRASCENESAEIWENRYPVRVLDFRLRTDSAGAGATRGGLGHVKALELLEDTYVSATIDRELIPPFGLHGGLPGTCNALTLEIDGVELGMAERYGLKSPSKFSNLAIPRGAIYRIFSGGGGGYGDPAQRPVGAVVTDVQGGYVSVEAARADYGVVVDPSTLVVDEDATLALRGDRR